MKASVKKKANNIIEFGRMKTEVLISIKAMRILVCDRHVREIIDQFTNWGFYQGSTIHAIDEKHALIVIDCLENYVKSLTKMQINQLKNVYNLTNRYIG